MKKLIYLVMLVSGSVMAQVGIGTTDPQATLHIVGDGTPQTGVIFPMVETLMTTAETPIGLVVYYDGPQTGGLKNALYIYTSRGWKRLLTN